MVSVTTSIVDELPHLRRYAFVLASDRTLAEDLVQDCVERAINRQHQYQPGTNFRSWLFTILRGQFLNHRRSARVRRVEPLDDGVATLNPSVTSNQEAHAELRQIEAALEKLSPTHRDVLLLVVIEGFAYEDAAEVLQVPVGTVRSRLARAREALAARLGRPAAPGPAAQPERAEA
mgnify:CR=1 FL=1